MTPDHAWLRDRTLRTSRRTAVRRAAVTGVATAAVMVATATAAVALGPRGGPHPAPATDPVSPSVAPSQLPPPSAEPTPPAPSAEPPPSAPAPTMASAPLAFSSSSSPTAPQPCRTADLKVKVERWTPETQAGAQRQASLSLTNTGDATCTLMGYPDLAFFDAAGNSRTTDVRHTGKASNVLLAAGKTAWSDLHWSTIPSADEAVTMPDGTREPACGPDPTTVRVTPPGQSEGVTTASTIGILCDGGRIHLSPLSLTRITTY
jgi:type IV secretory pathway VirB10-like protein